MKNLLLILALFVGASFIGEVSAHEIVIEKTKEVVKDTQHSIPFRDEFTWQNIEDLIELIDEEVKTHKPGHTINLLLDSGGGSVFAGINLIHKIMALQEKGYKFRGVVENLCASMCFVTLQTLDERTAYPYAMIMDHRPSGGSEHVLQEIVEVFKPLIDSKLKVDVELYNMAVFSEVWLGTKKAIRWGLLDRIINPGKPFVLPKSTK